ncbi:NAD(P)H-dependent oxidoreductase [Phaeobacter sp. CNT1-3]|nr:NAD(P)H-dependent oxidoreductase [Phaeobacter sp. CNT1-3]
MTVLTISGALRRDSENRKLVAEAAAIYGGDVVEADLNLPLYDGDLEAAEGLPQSVVTLADQILAAEAVLISTPEYNKAPPGVLKNALDWLSRDSRGVLAGKPVAVMSAAAGRTGGETAMFVLRHFLAPLRANVVAGPAVNVAASYNEFDENGKLTNDRYRAGLEELVALLKTTAQG